MGPQALNDDQLINHLKVLVRQEREDTAAVIEHLAEINRRKLAEKRGYPSLFEYCVKELGYPEPSAYHRIRAAHAIEKKPELLDLLRRGELHLRTIVLLHPYLDDKQADTLVQEARGKSQREVESLLAPFSPQPKQHDTIRVITVQAASLNDVPLFESISATMPTVEPETKVQVSFTANPRLLDLLQRAREILRHKYPDGKLEVVFEEALRALLERKDPDFWKPPWRQEDSATRKIPRWVRHAVWKRDNGRCVYQAADGRLCASRNNLEFDHIVPWARGGTSNEPGNIRLLCRSHNQLAAQQAGLAKK